MTDGFISAATRETLATEAFGVTARYDAAISRWFSEREDEFPQHFVAAFEKVLDLSYGENPHQRAAYYEQVGQRTHLLARTVKMHGKDLSYNNLLDLDSGRWLVREFELPAAAIIKHNNPCGCAVGETIEEAYERALGCDPQSAFGRVVVLNRKVGEKLADKLSRELRRAAVRARLRGRRVRDAAGQAQHPHHRGLRAAPADARRARHGSRHRRPADAGPRHRPAGARRHARGRQSASRPRPSGASCSSPGRSASTCARTRS